MLLICKFDIGNNRNFPLSAGRTQWVQFLPTSFKFSWSVKILVRCQNFSHYFPTFLPMRCHPQKSQTKGISSTNIPMNLLSVMEVIFRLLFSNGLHKNWLSSPYRNLQILLTNWACACFSFLPKYTGFSFSYRVGGAGVIWFIG